MPAVPTAPTLPTMKNGAEDRNIVGIDGILGAVVTIYYSHATLSLTDN
jgi:hypothetical protein